MDTSITVFPVSGFSGTVDVKLDLAPNGLTISPKSLAVSSSGMTKQKLTLSAADTTPVGMTNVNLVVSSPDSASTGTTGIAVTIQ